MVEHVKSKKQLKQFVLFIKKLYNNDPHYVFPLFGVQMKELTNAVLKDQKYTAIMAIRNNQICGRLLYTYDNTKDRSDKICFFSFFDAINNQEIALELFKEMETDMLRNNISYAEGSFTPYDPDTRRGILVSGFDIDPTIFTTYNFPYYQTLVENCGYKKKIDTVSLGVDIGSKSGKVLKAISAMFKRRHNVTISPLDLGNLDKEMDAIYRIFQKATNELTYQEAPSMSMIRNVAKNLRFFVNPDFIQIARENDTGEPIGFCLALPDYNQLFKKTKGKIRPLYLLLNKHKISKVRGILQYVVPEYQGTGLIGALFEGIFSNFPRYGITDLEAGTMLEDNPRPIQVFERLGGKIIKVYRIYGKEMNKDDL